ncbi:unnamed protein product, partial [marine sediment metagenome]
RDNIMWRGVEMTDEWTESFVDEIIYGEVGVGLTENPDYRRRKDNVPHGTESDHQCTDHRL